MLLLGIFSPHRIELLLKSRVATKTTDWCLKEEAFKVIRFKIRWFSCLDQSVRNLSLPPVLKDKVREYLLEDALQQSCAGLQSECQVEVETCGDPAPLLRRSAKTLYQLYSPNQIPMFVLSH